MALKSTICGIAHHARQARAHRATMVSSYKPACFKIGVTDAQCCFYLFANAPGRSHKP